MLAVQGLAAGYGQGLVLRGVDLQVQPGEIVCLMGRNGVGKSTLLKTIIGLLRPQGGRVLLQGTDVTAYQPHQRARAGIGYVPQGRGIFPYLTVRENLLMGLETRGGRGSGALDEVYALFPALAQHGAKLAGTLSGGQQQQLAIARALLGRPRLLLLDEPTEGIQPSIVLEIERAIARVRAERGVAVLLVEQYLDFALGVADRYFMMERGTIVAAGPTTSLSDEIIREYLAV